MARIDPGKAPRQRHSVQASSIDNRLSAQLRAVLHS